MKWRIQPREHGKALLLVECQNGADHGGAAPECARSLWRQPASGCMWQWDGNIERPTITPSIDCLGGCGRHLTMTNGVPLGSLGAGGK